jgi:hypothetical protein
VIGAEPLRDDLRDDDGSRSTASHREELLVRGIERIEDCVPCAVGLDAAVAQCCAQSAYCDLRGLAPIRRSTDAIRDRNHERRRADWYHGRGIFVRRLLVGAAPTAHADLALRKRKISALLVGEIQVRLARRDAHRSRALPHHGQWCQ